MLQKRPVILSYQELPLSNSPLEMGKGENKTSGMPPTGVAMTGSPAAIASRNALPIPSESEGRQKTSLVHKYGGNSSGRMVPKNRTRF
jgi:hypothetical protein